MAQAQQQGALTAQASAPSAPGQPFTVSNKQLYAMENIAILLGEKSGDRVEEQPKCILPSSNLEMLL